MTETKPDAERSTDGQREPTARQPRIVTIAGNAARHGRWRQLSRAAFELGSIPAAVMFGFAVLACLSIVADQTTAVPFLNTLRKGVGHLVGKNAASTALQAIATGLVTVTSITFSVLLLAVQQTASSLSPVVFDQFMRRKSNQAFLGFFVGLALFSYVVLAAVQDKTPPILGAAVATALTVVALLILLLLVYSTINQMRPTNVVRVIHDRALSAREREARLIRRTRRESTSQHEVSAKYVAHATGYVTGIDDQRLQRALADAGDAEICLRVTIGQHVAYGDLIAEVRDGNVEHAEDLAREVAAALQISRQRDLANDATTGVDELENIAWASTSSAKHNPEVAREALYALKDLATRWMTDDPVSKCEASDGEALAIVYLDNDLDRVLDTLNSLLIAAHESQQHMISAATLDVYRSLLDKAGDAQRRRLLRDLDTVGGIVDETPASPILRSSRRNLNNRIRELR